MQHDSPGDSAAHDGPPPIEWPDGATQAPRKGNGADGPAQLAPHKYPAQWVATAPLVLTSNPIVKGYIERGSFSVIYGPSGSGKSFLTADICQQVAKGEPWREHKTRQSLVVYVASEAGASIMKRFIGWRNETFSDAAELSPETLPLVVLTRGPDLLDPKAIKDLCLDIIGLEADCGHKCGLVVFDTLSRSIPGADENSAQDMTRAVQAADKLRDQFGCATLYVHHTGKDPDLGSRGHSSLKAACDLEICVIERTARVVKVRDGVAGEQFYFTLAGIDLGEDDDGMPVGTCMVQYTDTPNAPPKMPKAKATGKNQRLVYPILQALIASQGDASPGSSAIPKGVRTVQYDALCEAAMPKFTGRKPARIREAVSDALEGLQGSGIVGTHNGLIWINHAL